MPGSVRSGLETLSRLWFSAFKLIYPGVHVLQKPRHYEAAWSWLVEPVPEPLREQDSVTRKDPQGIYGRIFMDPKLHQA